MILRSNNGFTLIELIVTITLIAILASVILPITQLSIQRAKEQELFNALKEIRNAIDAYKEAGDKGHIYRNANTTGYPVTLEELVNGVVDIQDPKKGKIYFLRRIPKDPFYENQLIEPSKMWGIRSYRNDLGYLHYDGDIYDVYSLSKKVGLNSQPYKDW